MDANEMENGARGGGVADPGSGSARGMGLLTHGFNPITARESRATSAPAGWTGDLLPMAADHISNRLPAGSYNIGRTFLTLH
jgi:hypothetical protein